MTVTIEDNILAFFGSVGVKGYMRIKLSPDPLRRTDEWVVNPTSDKLQINKNPVAGYTDLFSQLLEAKKAVIAATYDGGFHGDIPDDKLTVADFTIKTNSLEYPRTRPGTKGKQKTFGLSSFKCIIGRPRLTLFPSSGTPLIVDLAACAVVTDGDRIEDTSSLVGFLLERRNINITPYLDGDELLKVELETDA